MNESSLIVVARGLQASSRLHEFIAWHAERLARSGAEICQLQATVERKEWPFRPPTFQATLKAGRSTGTVMVNAGEFGRSTPYLAIAGAFEQLAEALAAPSSRCEVDRGQRTPTLMAGA